MENLRYKFRAWTENTWLTDTLKEKMLYDYQDTTLVEVFGFNSEELPVMQYTGLKDKKGKEIYEKDIVHHKNTFRCPMDGKTMRTIDRNRVIVFESGAFRFDGTKGLSTLAENLSEIEVIGNIYEHSHLLEGK